jgi:hypothetical protein
MEGPEPMTYAPPPGEPPAPPPAPPPAGAPPGAPPPGWQNWSQPQAAAAAASQARPGIVTAAAITMIAIGALIVLFGLFFLLLGAVIGGASSQIDAQMPGFGAMSGAVTGVVIVIAVLLLAVGLLDIFAAARVFAGRSWARVTGIVLAIILGLLGLTSLGGNEGGSIVLGLAWVAANAFIAFALFTSGPWFAARSS